MIRRMRHMFRNGQSWALSSFLLAAALAACGGGSGAALSSSAAASAPPSTATAASKPAAPSGQAPATAGGSAAPKPDARSVPQAKLTGGDPKGPAVVISHASPSIADVPFYAAFSNGFFEQQHVNATMITMPANVAITALSTGEINFLNSPSNAIEGKTRGLPFTVVLSLWDRAPWTVIGKQDLKSIKDLKGKIVGTNQVGSSPYLYLRAAFQRAGLALTDAQIVSSPGTQDTFALLIGGKTDAGVVSPPFDVEGDERGFHEVEFIGDALKLPYVGLGTTTTYLKDHRPEVVATIRALMDANRWLKAHPSEAADLVVRYTGVTPEVARKSVAKGLNTLSDSGDIPRDGLQQAIDIQAELTKTPATVTPDQLVDFGPLKEALGK
jgi:ABC-type nitrate/sulfonate/bicarbonate transport system substrate-binding protein